MIVSNTIMDVTSTLIPGGSLGGGGGLGWEGWEGGIVPTRCGAIGIFSAIKECTVFIVFLGIPLNLGEIA